MCLRGIGGSRSARVFLADRCFVPLHQEGVFATACYAAQRTLGLQAGRIGHNVDDVFNGEARHGVVHQIGPGAVSAPLL